MVGIILEQGFKGKVYPVNPRGGEVLGLTAYTSVADIPGPVDYAFIQIPAQASLGVISDCATKGVKLAALFTAGFGESEIEGGNELEQELVRTARQGGMRLLGPNCMGVYCPEVCLSFASGLPQESGPVGALCQSGGYSNQLVRAAAAHGLRFSKVISFGNAADINEADLMEYFAQDPNTRIIIAYIEGAREGRHFFQALRVAAQAKPVIVFKGGRNEAGADATLSHTGSLAGSTGVWNGLLKQAGAIQAYSIEECVDIALALLRMTPPRSRKTVVIGYGGGATVQAADECYDAGLLLPRLPREITNELKKFIPVAGNIFKNPVDVSGLFFSPREVGHTIKVIGGWIGADVLILHVGLELTGISLVGMNMLEPLAEVLVAAAKDVGKPATLVAHAAYSSQAFQALPQLQQMCSEAGLPFYPSMQRAASAIDKVIRYSQDRGYPYK